MAIYSTLLLKTRLGQLSNAEVSDGQCMSMVTQNPSMVAPSLSPELLITKPAWVYTNVKNATSLNDLASHTLRERTQSLVHQPNTASNMGC